MVVLDLQDGFLHILLPLKLQPRQCLQNHILPARRHDKVVRPPTFSALIGAGARAGAEHALLVSPVQVVACKTELFTWVSRHLRSMRDANKQGALAVRSMRSLSCPSKGFPAQRIRKSDASSAEDCTGLTTAAWQREEHAPRTSSVKQ